MTGARRSSWPPLPLLLLLMLLADRTTPQTEAAAGAHPYVHKCCEADKASVDGKCEEVGEPFRSNFKFEVPKLVNASGVFGVYETNKFHIIDKNPICTDDGFFPLEPLEDDAHIFLVSETGDLVNISGAHIASPDQYCLEQFVINNFTSILVQGIVCIITDSPTTETTETLKNGSDLKSKSNLIGMMISLPFLFSTFLTYAFIKELRSSCHVKFQMCHVASLWLAYMAFIINKYFSRTIYEKNITCLILAYTQQYFFIATFFWLNAMCFNIWWTLCEFKPLNRNKQKEAKKFIKYSLYAWGSPLLISIVTYFMDEIFSSSNLIRPEFGYNKCWFDNESAKWVYFYGPIAIILVCDLLMFIHTSKILFEKEKIGQEYLKGSESSGSRKYNKQNFILYLKLFIITGGNWLTEIISYATHSEGGIWGITDIGNALQGVFIFVILICQKRVLSLLNQKLCSRFKHYNSRTRHNIIRSTCHKTNTSTINENSV